MSCLVLLKIVSDQNKILHIIPAAGKATRFGGIPKFLLPISKDNFLIKYHVNEILFKDYDVKKVVAVSKENYQTLKRLDLNAELICVDTLTMNETVVEIINEYSDYENYIFTMPDTYFKDSNIVNEMCKKFFLEKNVCITGLFKIQEYQKGKLGQCNIDDEFITELIDKKLDCDFENAWGLIMWNKEINKLISKKDESIGFIINKAIEEKYSISYVLGEGNYYDCGTFEEYKKLLTSIDIK